MRKGEATRVRIVDAAARLAAVRGLTAVSLGDVADVVGLSKSGLFKHFESKEDMHMSVVEAVTDHFRDVVWGPAEGLAPGRDRLEAVFEHWLHWCDREWGASGCPIMQLSVELDDQPGPPRDLLQKSLRSFRRTLVREFQAMCEPALPEGEAEAAYFQMKSFILGHSDARRMMGDADAERATRAAFEALLDRTAAIKTA